nr:class I SAM-dependent methyltransferase [Methylacidiphilum kamchatkense]
MDIGCGQCHFYSYIKKYIDKYVGVDIIRYDSVPNGITVICCDLNEDIIPIEEQADLVVSIETIEHLENPRSFFRNLVRLTKPGGLIAVSTPNNLSLRSIGSLLLRGHFAAFQEGNGNYPAHITALLEIDLLRLAKENHLINMNIGYSNKGKIPWLSFYWPSFLKGKLFSDNIVLLAQKPI